jgi:hypothetical protein
MKTLIKTVILGNGLALLGLLAIVDMPSESPLIVQMVPEAHAVMGVRRRSMRRGVVIGSSMAASGAASAAPAPALAPAPAPTAQPAGAPPLGSIVTTLPAGCGTTTKGGVQYSNCSGVYYRAAFQGSNLVYVVSQP